MSLSVAEIEAEARKLEAGERAELIERLLLSYGRSVAPDLDDEAFEVWIEEAERRDRAGEEEVSAEEVFRKARASLRPPAR